jgi:hypothetical protein
MISAQTQQERPTSPTSPGDAVNIQRSCVRSCNRLTLPRNTRIIYPPKRYDCLPYHNTKRPRIPRQKVIVSFPTPLYRTITFSPPLPEDKATLADSTVLGYYAKTILIYNKPWWRDLGLNASFTSLIGFVSFTRDTSVPQDFQFSITCFIVGGTGHQGLFSLHSNAVKLYLIKLVRWLDRRTSI